MNNNSGGNIIKDFWNKLDPKRKKTVSVLLISTIVVVIALGGYFFSHHGKTSAPQSTNSTNKTMSVTLQPGVLEQSMNNKLDEKLSDFEKKLKDLEKMQNATANATKSNQALSGNATGQQLPNLNQLQNGPNGVPSSYNNPPPPPMAGYPSGLGPNGYPNGQAQPQSEIIGEIGVASNDKIAGNGTAQGQSVKKKNSNSEVYLPPSFMQANLLSGLDAPTMEGANSNPVPVLLRVGAPAVLPNAVKANLKGCFIIAEGTGNLASERVMLRLVSISCIAKNGDAVIDQQIKGFVVDSDGKIGLRGRVVSKMGAVLARAAFAGFLTGFGNAISASSYTNYSSSLGTTSTLNGGDVARAAIGGGASEAAKKLADFYMKLANQTLPVIEIGATRNVTAVVSKGETLQIKNMCVGGKKCSLKDDEE